MNLPSLLSSSGFSANLDNLLLQTGADMPTDQPIDDGSSPDYSIQPVGYDPGTAIATRAGAAVGAGAKLVLRAIQLFGAAAAMSLIPQIAGAVGTDAGTLLARTLKRRRGGRGRGITSRDLRTTRRTIGKVTRMYQALQQSFGRARGGGQRRAPFRPRVVAGGRRR